MRVAVIYRPRTSPPPEAVPMMMEGMARWVEKYENRFSPLEFFVGGGGFGVADVSDAAEMHRIAAEHPFTAYSDVEIKPIVEPRAAMAIMSEALAARAGA